MLGDSITTDHISPGRQHQGGLAGRRVPAGARRAAARLQLYGARRGNHEVMMRGTFANIRIKNQMVPGHRGRLHPHLPRASRPPSTTRPCATRPRGTPLVILAGKEYGTGSSRDWAAKGTALLGVRAVIAESFERIHRSNLVGMGVLPLRIAANRKRDAAAAA
jgi:aconitate hydratase